MTDRDIIEKLKSIMKYAFWEEKATNKYYNGSSGYLASGQFKYKLKKLEKIEKQLEL